MKKYIAISIDVTSLVSKIFESSICSHNNTCIYDVASAYVDKIIGIQDTDHDMFRCVINLLL